ncbi:MAG: hypothetical protein IJ153_11115 [Clostridia bacterium]|nr:hypothetical protein [Clostridia bacterium]MBQ9212237.1 hypothetical protein [Clostridia bacterium]
MSRLHRIFAIILFLSLLAGLIFSAIQLVGAPIENNGDEAQRTKSDYTLMVVECIAGLLVMMLPSVLERRLSLHIPHLMYVLYDVFLYCAVFLGEVHDFYYRVPYWDSILHFFSGLMLGTLGFILVDFLNRSNKTKVTLSPIFVSIFAFCFALAAGSIWEIYEYTIDGVMGLNMQKYLLADKTIKIGRDALQDTMKDIIIDTAASLLAAVLGYLSIKKHNQQASSDEF